MSLNNNTGIQAGCGVILSTFTRDYHSTDGWGEMIYARDTGQQIVVKRSSQSVALVTNYRKKDTGKWLIFDVSKQFIIVMLLVVFLPIPIQARFQNRSSSIPP